MKTKSTKSLLLGLSLIVATATVNAQAPFGTPPGGNLQPPTPDKIVPNVPTDYVAGPGATYSGGTTIPSCVFDDIQRTGNDLQEIPGSGLVAEAMVWDGSCPSFSLTVSGDALSQSPLQAAFIVNLDANNFGFVSDPDIIVSQTLVAANTIGILIVYEFKASIGGVNHVAYEQWNYDYSTNTISFVPTGPQPNIISSGVDSDNPNIDGNNDNEVAIVYHDGQFQVSTFLDYFTANTMINPINRIQLNMCGPNGGNPDVTVSDAGPFPSVASYVYQSTQGLIVHHEDFVPLFSSLTPTCGLIFPLGTDFINPRIDAPEDMAHQYEFAAVADNIGAFNEEIFLFHNFPGVGAISGFSLNTSLTFGCANDFPAIAFPEDHFIAVSWTYDDCTSIISGNQEIIAVSYDLNVSQRIPADPNYYMLVSQNTGGNQFASSLASGRQNGTGGTVHAPVLYSFASQGPNEMRYKLSGVTSQPQVRKKFIADAVAKIEIYPNPAKNFVNIDFSSLQTETAISLRILSVEGKTVYEKNGLPNTFNQGVDLNNFDSGIYLIEYRYNDTVKQEKLIVQ